MVNAAERDGIGLVTPSVGIGDDLHHPRAVETGGDVGPLIPAGDAATTAANATAAAWRRRRRSG